MIDHRHNYILVVDVETANDLEDALVYDIGYSVRDTKGRTYEEKSYAISDIFTDRPDLMDTAYYAEKLPAYYEDLASGEREEINFTKAKFDIRNVLKKYGITEVYAHNARFDLNALNKTERYLTKSTWRYFFPKNVEICDSLKMARAVFKDDPNYREFCESNGYMTNHKVPQCRFTAEVLYRYLTNNTDFVEEHQGLADVRIESEIVNYCYKRCKKEDRLLYA